MSDFYVHIRNVFTSRNEWLLCTYKKRIHIHGMSDFYVHIRNVFTLRNEWLLCTYKKRIHITEWVTVHYVTYIRMTFVYSHSHHGMSDFYVHIRNVFTLRNEWLLCTYKKRIHITEWVTLRRIVTLCTYKKRIHITEWVTFMYI